MGMYQRRLILSTIAALAIAGCASPQATPAPRIADGVALALVDTHTPQPSHTPTVTATPDLSLQMTAGALSVQMTGTAGVILANQQAAQAEAARLSNEATARVINSQATQIRATDVSIALTQTEEPIARVETQAARNYERVSVMATDLAESADADELRTARLDEAKKQGAIWTLAVGAIALLLVGGVAAVVYAAYKMAQAKADSIGAESRAKADGIRQQTDAAIERQRAEDEHRRAMERLRVEQAQAAPPRSVQSPPPQVSIGAPRNEAWLDMVDRHTRDLYEFLKESARLAEDGWGSDIIPAQSLWTSASVRDKHVGELERRGLVRVIRGRNGATRLVGEWATLDSLARALESGALRVYPTESPTAPPDDPEDGAE